jgi:hypothetical protein
MPTVNIGYIRDEYCSQQSVCLPDDDDDDDDDDEYVEDNHVIVHLHRSYADGKK